ncbi:hypothetical protein Tco_1397641 [Tanacetum coccineum]
MFMIFLDDDLPSEYYKELLYGMFQKQKRLKKYVDYEQLTDVLAMYKSVLEEELRATKSKLKLYDRCYVCNVRIFVNVKFGMQMKYKCRMCKMVCKCSWLSFGMQIVCKCKLQIQIQAINVICKLQMQSANANASCKCKYRLQMQMQAANANASC